MARSPQRKGEIVDMQSILESIEQHRKALSEAGEANKAVIFEALSAAGIDLVSVTFDGEGDSGQIENIIAHKGETQLPIADKTITLRSVSWDGKDLALRELPFREAIEQLCYDFLEQEHGVWENNDGAFGKFTLRVADQAVELEFNGRYTDTHTTSHTL
jgi:hypothetical protein